MTTQANPIPLEAIKERQQKTWSSRQDRLHRRTTQAARRQEHVDALPTTSDYAP